MWRQNDTLPITPTFEELMATTCKNLLQYSNDNDRNVDNNIIEMYDTLGVQDSFRYLFL